MDVETCSSPCWDCVKGRHLICDGWDVDDRARCDCPHTKDGVDRNIGLEWVMPDGPYNVIVINSNVVMNPFDQFEEESVW